MVPVRMSRAKARVLNELLREPAVPRWGYDLMRRTGLGSGSLYPILSQLESAGWIKGTWELDKQAAGGPPRKAYRVTPKGLTAAPAALLAFGSRSKTIRRSEPRGAN